MAVDGVLLVVKMAFFHSHRIQALVRHQQPKKEKQRNQFRFPCWCAGSAAEVCRSQLMKSEVSNEICWASRSNVSPNRRPIASAATGRAGSSCPGVKLRHHKFVSQKGDVGESERAANCLLSFHFACQTGKAIISVSNLDSTSKNKCNL